MTPIERMAQTLIRDLEVITTNNSIPVYEFNDLVQDYKGCGFEITLMQPIKNKNESSYLISEGALMSFSLQIVYSVIDYFKFFVIQFQLIFNAICSLDNTVVFVLLFFKLLNAVLCQLACCQNTAERANQ